MCTFCFDINEWKNEGFNITVNVECWYNNSCAYWKNLAFIILYCDFNALVVWVDTFNSLSKKLSELMN